jgi:2-polyprenyl-6-methoxyphenol hydroxylase-like FAD-dependent oxidoreductase
MAANGEVGADRAVVLGGGMAGLLAARVLAEHHGEVLVVDRDELTGVQGPRRGVPHGRHAHGLLAAGQRVLEDLFPGLADELRAAGIPSGDLAGDLRWYVNGERLAQAPAGLLSVSATRPELEAHVRARVAALPGVRFVERCVIRGLVVDAAAARVVGARVVPDGGAEQVLEAALVVDATGRGSRTPQWLAELGYERPTEDRVKIDLAYTTRHYRLASDPYGDDLSINPLAWPGNLRGAFFPRLADGTSMLTLTGMLGDHPPTDDEGFLAFVRTVAAPEIHEAVRDAEPVDEPVTFRVPASVRRRYERLRRFPDGYVVVGDGVCSFNPVYGQGMTVAAMEAAALREHLRSGPVRPLEFFRAIAPIVDVPWDTSAAADLAFPGVQGRRTPKVRLANAFGVRLHAAAVLDGRFTAAFFRVAGLVDPPQALMHPRLVLGVLRTLWRGRRRPLPARPAPSGAAATRAVPGPVQDLRRAA